MDLTKIQKEVFQNKINKGFNTTDVNKEFCLLYGEDALVNHYKNIGVNENYQKYQELYKRWKNNINTVEFKDN